MSKNMPENRSSDQFPAFMTSGYVTFKEKNFPKDAALYQRLATKGQFPQALVISCCDARVEPFSLFGVEPGDLFILRNVANMVPPFEPDDHFHGTSAAVEFAVTGLKIPAIVVLGHSGCGGVMAAREMADGENPPATFVQNWTRPLAERAREMTNAAGEPVSQRALEEENIRMALTNLMDFPFVADAVKNGTLGLYGGHFDIEHGNLRAFDPATGAFVSLSDD